MSDDPYKSPASDTIISEPLYPVPTKLPWTRWIIVVQMFLTFGIYTNVIAATLSNFTSISSENIWDIRSGLMLITLIFMFGVATLRRGHVILSGLTFIFVGLVSFKTHIHWLTDRPTPLPGIIATLIYVAPSFIAAWYLLRPSFLDQCLRYRKYQEMLATQRYVSRKFMGKQ